jgi:hypothetical protein
MLSSSSNEAAIQYARRELGMFATAAELQTALLAKEPRDFVSHYLFEPIPFAFGDDVVAWIEWKTELARGIDVDPYDIVLTGSAAVGFSLNPKKGYKPFDAESDIDCGVVSQHYFETAWRYLRQLRPSWLSLPPESKRAIVAHQKRYVFAGAIATDSILALLPFGSAWQRVLDQMSQREPTIGRDIKLRIYRDYESLRHYQSNGIERLRSELALVGEGDTEIQTEG